MWKYLFKNFSSFKFINANPLLFLDFGFEIFDGTFEQWIFHKLYEESFIFLPPLFLQDGTETFMSFSIDLEIMSTKLRTVSLGRKKLGYFTM